MAVEVPAAKLDLVPGLLEEFVMLCLDCIGYFDEEIFGVKRSEKTAAAIVVAFVDPADLHAEHYLAVAVTSEQASSWVVAALVVHLFVVLGH